MPSKVMMKSKIWHNKILLIQIFLLTMIMCLQIHSNVEAYTPLREAEAQKIEFFQHPLTNGACVDNFERLWLEEMSAEERAHWDGIEGMEIEHFDQFIKRWFSYNSKNDEVTMDTNNFKLIEESDKSKLKQAWKFNMYIFKGFSFYFSPAGQITQRNMAKIAFLLAWQRQRFRATDKAMDCLFKNFFWTPNVYMCKLLEVAFRMPTGDKLKNVDTAIKKAREEDEQQQQRHDGMMRAAEQQQYLQQPPPQHFQESQEYQQQLQHYQQQIMDKGKDVYKWMSDYFTRNKTLRARFQKLFDRLHRNKRKTKLEAFFNHLREAKYRNYLEEICPIHKVKNIPITQILEALAQFALNYIVTFVPKIMNEQSKQSTPIWRIKSYIEMKKHFEQHQIEWQFLRQNVYKYMELYGGHRLTSFDPYEASELPVLLYMCLYKHTTRGDPQMETLVDSLTNHHFNTAIHGLSLEQALDAWKPKWLSESGIWSSAEEPLRRIPYLAAIDGGNSKDISVGEGKRKIQGKDIVEEEQVLDVQIFMPIDEMNAEHIEFLLKKHHHSVAEWKWSEVRRAPIEERYPSEEIQEFDIMAFLTDEDRMGAEMDHVDLMEAYNKGGHIRFIDWVSQSYQRFKLQYLTTGKAAAGLTGAQRLDFAVQIYMRLFYTFKPVDTRAAEDIGKKLVHLIGQWELAQQLEARKPVRNSCEVADHDPLIWIDQKLSHFKSEASSSSSSHLTGASLLRDNDPCIEASTQWVRRLLNFDLTPAYGTDLAQKLLNLVRYDSTRPYRERLQIEFGEARLMEQIKGKGTSSSSARRNSKKQLRTDLNAILTALDTKVWQMAQRRLEAMLASLPNNQWPVDRQVPPWAQMFNANICKSKRIRRARYFVHLRALIHLFAYVQLGTLISLNRLVAEILWTDSLNGTRELLERSQRMDRKMQKNRIVMELRAKFVDNLHSLHKYLQFPHDQQKGISVPGLQPTAIRPKHNENGQGKNMHELAKMAEKQEKWRKETAKYVGKIAIKMLTTKEKRKKKKQQRYRPHREQSTMDDINRQLEQMIEEQERNWWNPYYSPFPWCGYHNPAEEVENGQATDGETIDLSDLGIDADTVSSVQDLFDIGNIGFDFDWASIFDYQSVFSSDGWLDNVIGSAFDLATNSLQETLTTSDSSTLFNLVTNMYETTFNGGGGGRDGASTLAGANPIQDAHKMISDVGTQVNECLSNNGCGSTSNAQSSSNTDNGGCLCCGGEDNNTANTGSGDGVISGSTAGGGAGSGNNNNNNNNPTCCDRFFNDKEVKDTIEKAVAGCAALITCGYCTWFEGCDPCSCCKDCDPCSCCKECNLGDLCNE